MQSTDGRLSCAASAALRTAARLDAVVRRRLSRELCSNRVRCRHVGKTERKVQETRDVHLLVDGSGSIRREEHPVVPVVRIPRR